MTLPSRRSLILENLALRQQLAVYKRNAKRPRLRPTDRLFWVWLSRCWSDWRSVVDIVRPKTVVGWHRQGFRRYWCWKSRQCGRKQGRPRVAGEVRALIRTMKQANPLWGAPRIHGELLKLGFEISERTISRLLSQDPSASVAKLAGLSRQSRQGLGGVGLLHRPHDQFPNLVCIRCPGPRASPR